MMANIQRVPATRPGTFFYHVNDGYYYNFSFHKGDSIYFKCIKAGLGCPGRAIIHRFNGFRQSQDHEGHPRDMLHAQYAMARQKILGRCKKAPDFVPFQRIIEKESRNCHMRVQGKLATRALRCAMERARAKSYPSPIPQTIEDLSNILQDRRYSKLTSTIDKEDNLFAGVVTANNGSKSILFASKRMISFMRKCHSLFSDGTFSIVPLNPPSSQVFVILTLWDYHIIPLMWVLMEDRKEASYRAVLAAIKLLMKGRWKVKKIMADWENAQRKAWKGICPRAKLLGCYFHYAKAILDHATITLGLRWWIMNDRFVRGIVRMLCAIPLLPGGPKTHKKGLLMVARLVTRRGRFYKRLLRDLLKYVWKRWITNKRRQKSLRLFGAAHRTNNACESLNRTMNKLLGKHPNIYKLIRVFVTLENKAWVDIYALAQGLEPRRARRASAVSNDKAIRALGRGLRNAPDRRRAAILRYLYGAAFTLRKYINHYVFH